MVGWGGVGWRVGGKHWLAALIKLWHTKSRVTEVLAHRCDGSPITCGFFLFLRIDLNVNSTLEIRSKNYKCWLPTCHLISKHGKKESGGRLCKLDLSEFKYLPREIEFLYKFVSFQ